MANRQRLLTPHPTLSKKACKLVELFQCRQSEEMVVHSMQTWLSFLEKYKVTFRSSVELVLFYYFTQENNTWRKSRKWYNNHLRLGSSFCRFPALLILMHTHCPFPHTPREECWLITPALTAVEKTPLVWVWLVGHSWEKTCKVCSLSTANFLISWVMPSLCSALIHLGLTCFFPSLQVFA